MNLAELYERVRAKDWPRKIGSSVRCAICRDTTLTMDEPVEVMFHPVSENGNVKVRFGIVHAYHARERGACTPITVLCPDSEASVLQPTKISNPATTGNLLAEYNVAAKAVDSTGGRITIGQGLELVGEQCLRRGENAVIAARVTRSTIAEGLQGRFYGIDLYRPQSCDPRIFASLTVGFVEKKGFALLNTVRVAQEEEEKKEKAAVTA